MLSLYQRWFGAFALFLAPCGVMAAEAADPLALARQGYLECGTVDVVSKTCEEIAQYVPRPDGKFDLISQQVVSYDPHIVMTYRSLVFVDGELICSGLVASDFDFATFTVAGKKAGSDDALFYRNQMRDLWLQLVGKTSCMKLVAQGDTILAEYYLDGVLIPDRQPAAMQWIKPENNFKLKGAN